MNQSHKLTSVAFAAVFAIGCAGGKGGSAEPQTAVDEKSDEKAPINLAAASAEDRKKEAARVKEREKEQKRMAAEGRGDFDRGLAAFRSGDMNGAKGLFEKAIAAEPTKAAGAYANVGTILYLRARETGDKALYAEAVGKVQRALAIESDNMAAYSTLALIYYQTAEGDRSKLKLAELVCDEAKKINDKFAPIYNTKGLIQLKLKNVSGALKEFEKAVELDPKFVEAHLNIGAIGLSSRSYQKSEASFQAVLKLQSSNIDATIGMGVAARGQKKFDEAEKYYKKAAEIDSRSCSVPYNLGLLYQDYKPTASEDEQRAAMKQAQTFYRQYVSCGKSEKVKVADAEKRIKDIDDTFDAMAKQKQMEADNARILEEAKRQEQQQQQQQTPPPATPAK